MSLADLTPEALFNAMCRDLDRSFLPSLAHAPLSWWKPYVTDAIGDSPVIYLDDGAQTAAAKWVEKNPFNKQNADHLFRSVIIATPATITAISFPNEERHGTILIYAKASEREHGNMVMGSYVLLAEGHAALVYAAQLSHENGELFGDIDIRDDEPLYELLRKRMYYTLDLMRYIDAPRHHLVVESPKRWEPRVNRPKVNRAQDRPRVRLLAPEDVQRIYPHRTGASTGRTVAPHARRGYSKTLRASRYKEPGKRVTVRPTWVGDGEWESGGIRYRVIHRPDATK